MILTFRSSDGLTRCGPRNLRFRFVVFDVKMWLRNAVPRLTLPEPVSVNRFFAPLLLFILGMKLFLGIMLLVLLVLL